MLWSEGSSRKQTKTESLKEASTPLTSDVFGTFGAKVKCHLAPAWNYCETSMGKLRSHPEQTG